MTESTFNSRMQWTVVSNRTPLHWPAVCRWFYARPLYRHSERVYLACLSRAADRADGLCEVTFAELIEDCVLPGDQVRRAFSELTTLGMLSVLSSPDPSGRQSNDDQLCLEVRLPKQLTDTIQGESRSGDVAAGV